MTSIYRQVLGADFDRLHPMIQRRFGFSSADEIASIGRGVMDEVWRGRFYTLPFLYVGTWRRIMFPDVGSDIPFTILNYAYLDDFGRETVTWLRRFETPRSRRTDTPPRRFDAYMIYSEQRGRIVDYLGSHQHLAVDLDLSVADGGGLRLTSGEQRFYEGPLAFRFPMAFSGRAEVLESYDDEAECYRISVSVRNRLWGPLFGYRGRFQVEERSVSRDEIPADIFPRREERRE